METIKKAWKWLVMSSADPSKVALTVKGFLTAAIPFIILSSGVFHFNVDSDSLTALFEEVGNVVMMILTVVGTIQTIWGLARKIGLSLN